MNNERAPASTRACDEEWDLVTARPLKDVANDRSDAQAADGAGHAADSYHGAYCARGKHVRGERIEIGGKCLGGTQRRGRLTVPRTTCSPRDRRSTTGITPMAQIEHGELASSVHTLARV